MESIFTLLSDISLTLSVIVAIIFGIFEARSSNRERRENFAVDYLGTFRSREFAELIQYVTSNDMPVSSKKLHALSQNDQVIFIQLSQQMESLGLLVSGEFISINLIDRTLGSYVTVAWKKYESLFLELRKDDPFQGEYFQWLSDQLERNLLKNPRLPFYLQGEIAK
jgi:hypothetical protein